MGKFIFGIIVGIISIPVAFYIYCATGSAPVATSSPPMPFEMFFAKTALHATIRKNAPKTHTAKATESELLDGADVYHHNCAICHGLPGRPKSRIAAGEFPRPPQLLQPDEMVTDDPVGVTYWKAKNGIRLSGMPAFGDSLKDTQLWNVARMLANADKLPPAVKSALESPPVSAQPNVDKQAAPPGQ